MSKTFFVLSAIFLFAVSAEAAAERGSLRGGRASQARQNEMADARGLSRLKDRAELKRFIKAGLLVPVRGNESYAISKHLGSQDPGHESLYRHARPWAKAFLDDVLGEGHGRFGEEFRVTSLVRTREYQRRLGKKNRNAIVGDAGWRRSAHLTGSAVDISYLDLSPEAKRWLSKRLTELERKGLVEATMEHGQACFHVMVSPDYGKNKKKASKKKPRQKKKRAKPAR